MNFFIFFVDYMKKNVLLHRRKDNGPLAQLNRVFDYGSKGCRFESCRGHEEKTTANAVVFLFLPFFLEKIFQNLGAFLC